MVNFTEDSRVLDTLYRQFDYLMDLPCQLRGMNLEVAEYLATLETDEVIGFVLGYPVEGCQLERDHFTLLSAAENQAIQAYRLLKPVIPWPQPTIGLTSTGGDLAQVSGVHHVDVVMRSCGTAQVWWGGEVAVLWEAILEGQIRQRQDYEAVINQFWSCCEGYLGEQGVKRIYTYNRDPLMDLGWYQGFLSRRNYQPVEQRKITVVKHMA